MPDPILRVRDLGHRLAAATAEAFADGARRVVVIGTDCPSLDEDWLIEAFQRLESRDLVFGPALDGGYYLIGMSRPCPADFESIDWGGPKVLDQSLAAALLHLPPKGQQTVRYYGIYSNRSRGSTLPTARSKPAPPAAPAAEGETTGAIQILLIPPPPKQAARDLRPLWRDLILKVWGGDPLECPCCKGTMRPVRTFIRPEVIEFFLRLHALWEGIIQLPRPPPPPFDIDTMEPIEPPWQAIKEWIPDDEPDLDWFNRPRNPSNPDPDGLDQCPTWRPEEIPLDDERILVLDDT